MAKQGRASISGPHDRKVEPTAKGVNPGAVSYLGNHLGNHASDGGGTMNLRPTPWDAGRGYHAPGIGTKTHGRGSQGKY
jgi:hypothetical protein